MENEIIETGNNRNEIAVSRDPNLVLAEAKKAAAALMTVVAQKKKPVIMNGEQYLEFEDWQTVAKFYGLTVKVAHTNFLDLGGVKGFEATAEVIRADGAVISSADAMCLNDEEKWSTRSKYDWVNGVRTKIGETPVPLFQLRSMAQTRACAKALRNVLAWVVVLGGFKPTPAEEMTDGLNPLAKEKPVVSSPKEKKETPAAVAKTEPVKENTPGTELNVLDALKQPEGATFDVWGILFDHKSMVTKTKKDVTYYKLSPRGSTVIMEISKFGKAHVGIANGDVIKFTGVKVSTYNGELKYLAQGIEVITNEASAEGSNAD